MVEKKKSLSFYLRIYRKIVVQDIKSKMSYRADFIISLIGMLAINTLQAVGFWLVYQNFPAVGGWNYHEMLFLYGFSLLSATPAQCLFDNNWSLRHKVYSGDFIKYCFRPINLFFYFMSEVFDVKGLGQMAFGLVTVIYSWNKLDLAVNFISIIAFIAAVLSASLFIIAILNIAASMCFWMVNSFFALSLSNTLRDYAKYPISIFKGALKAAFTFVIPVAFMAYYPSLVIVKPDEVNWIVWSSPAFGILFFYLSYKIWMKGATAYNGTGS